jgi:putative FmdB family regulatory protein
MPIYEFRCLSCNHYFELLSVRKDDTLEMKCPSCEAEEVERVLSCVSYVMGSSSSSKETDKTKVTSKSCSSGTCATIDIPGPSR